MPQSALIGKRVLIHKTKSIGIIETVEGKIISVSVHGEIYKFPYPECFATILELEDRKLQEELEEESAEASFESFRKIYGHAIKSEIGYLKSTGGKKYRAIDGEQLVSPKGEYIYAFDTDTDMRFPDGTAIKIWQSDGIKSGYIVSCEEFTIVIRTKEPIGQTLSEIEFTTEQWILLEALEDRLYEINPQLDVLAHEVACKGTLQINHGRGIACGQNLAYKRATSEPITFIWGPPGTGKTETLANITLDYMEQGKKVLMLSYSNVSVDGALLRVVKKADCSAGKILRYGYPRASELLNEYKEYVSYQYVYSQNPSIAEEIKNLNALKRKLKKRDPERTRINKKLASIRQMLLEQEKEAVLKAQFVATTVSKAIIDKTIYGQQFDAVIFDEASMAYIPQVVFAAGLAREHFICLGDFCQLPAIVQDNTNDQLMVDIFEYTGITSAVENNCGHNWLVMLNEQFRMHKDIAGFVNKYVYGNRLITSEKIYESRKEIATCEPISGQAVALVDLSGTYSVCVNTMDGSRINLFSALLCIRIAEEYLDKYEVGIITPYSAQSRLILSMVRDMQEVDARYARITSATVHQFQGSEKPVIIYDAVDCFRMAYPGVLLTSMKNNSANRLFNVALTRAKGKFILVGNLDYFKKKRLSKNLMFAQVINDLKNQQDYFQGAEIIQNYGTDAFDEKKAVYLQERDISASMFFNDLRLASKEIHMDIPGMIDDNDEAMVELIRILNEKEESGVEITIKLFENAVLPEELQKYAQFRSYVTTPITVIDRSVVWFGQPFSAADFISEGEIIDTRYFPCLRFNGSITARGLKAFLDL